MGEREREKGKWRGREISLSCQNVEITWQHVALSLTVEDVWQKCLYIDDLM